MEGGNLVPGHSFALRSLAAVSLMIGFYGLAVAMLAGLLFIPYAEWTYGGRIHLRVAFGCLVGAAAILIAILPRREVFRPPGPQLVPDRHPRLFQCIERVAARTQQKMPREVFLVPDVNAWVADRGGFMGMAGVEDLDAAVLGRADPAARASEVVALPPPNSGTPIEDSVDTVIRSMPYSAQRRDPWQRRR